ncbi:caspase family protein, partial [Klebsiella pneumoniae]|uniref:caspase family protein n=1 Tax=Klebsiella pneumoniae TaxID=573 RepID=UPI003B987E81
PIKDKWALIVGISKFKNDQLNLRYPSKDAKDFYQFLTTTGNFAPDHVKLLTDKQATRGNILSLLGDKWLPRVANPDDLVVIY